MDHYCSPRPRRTVTRADISQAAAQSDMFDFLIDFLPPDERRGGSSTGTSKRTGGTSWQKGQENNPTQFCVPATSVARRTVQKDSSSKQAKKIRASPDAVQETQPLIDGAPAPQVSGVAESSPTTCNVDSATHHHKQETSGGPKPPQVDQLDALGSSTAAQRSEAILREAGSPETNVFYEQIQTYISAPHPPQTRLPLPPTRHSAALHSNPHTQSNQNSQNQPQQ